MCALLFSVQILCVDRYAPMMNPVALSCIQFFVCGAISFAAALIFEFLPDPAAWFMSLSSASAWIAILYTGIFSCGGGYTLQALGQRSLTPALASLIMSLESVFSTIFGWLILHQTMTGKELAGCALIFAAVLLAQIPVRRA
jgi:drug/metabolite transporter (DMT)-like permease